MHIKCYDELRKMDIIVKSVRNRQNESVNNRSMMMLMDEQKMCCHQSMKDLQVHTDGAWWKLKNMAFIQE